MSAGSTKSHGTSKTLQCSVATCGLTDIEKEDTSTQHDKQTTSSNNHGTQANGTKPSEEAMKNDDMSKKTMKRIQPERIAEVGEWKAEKEGEERGLTCRAADGRRPRS